MYSICSAELNTALFKDYGNNGNRNTGQNENYYADDHFNGDGAVACVCVIVDIICGAFI